jgi:hypothetical protein
LITPPNSGSGTGNCFPSAVVPLGEPGALGCCAITDSEPESVIAVVTATLEQDVFSDGFHIQSCQYFHLAI